MNAAKTWHKDRVGIFLNPQTRDHLNVLKAQLSLQKCESLSQDDVIRVLIDHYRDTVPQTEAEPA